MEGTNEKWRLYGLVGPRQHLESALDALKVDLAIDSFQGAVAGRQTIDGCRKVFQIMCSVFYPQD